MEKLSPKKFKAATQAYFDLCDAENEAANAPDGAKKSGIKRFYTVSGLCRHLGLTREKFDSLAESGSCKAAAEAALLRIENFIEENLLAGKIPPQAAIIFLKYHFGWSDKPRGLSDGEVFIDLGEDVMYAD